MSAPDYFSEITYLMLETNSTCNLACRFCNRPQLVEMGLRAKKIMSREEFHSLCTLFTQTRLDTIKLEGLSEPMMCPQFEWYAETLRSYFPEAFVIIATNLQYNLEKTPFVATLPFVDMVYLSIDGVGSAYEEARPGAKYERLLSSLADIKRLVPKEVRQQKLHINFVCSPYNYQTLPKMYEFKEEYDLASVRINLAQNWNEDEMNPLDFSQEMLDFLQPYKGDVKGVSGWEYNECFWPFAGMIVDVYGDFRQCIINTSQEALGNVFNDDVRAIFNESAHYREVRRTLQKNCAPHVCRNCDYNNLSPILQKLQGGKHIPAPPRSFVMKEEFTIVKNSTEGVSPTGV